MDLQSFINRQMGLRTSMYYDAALKRLVVSKNDNMTWDASAPIFACRFAECPGFKNVIATANEAGRVDIMNTCTFAKANFDDTTVHGVECHSNAIFDLAWMQKDAKFITVSGDHTARLWSVNYTKLEGVFCGHERSIKTAVFRPYDDEIFATGARDGNIFLWDVRDAHTSRPEISILRCHPILNTTPVSAHKRWIEPGRNSITSVVFQDEMTLISCGAGDGYIKFWDLRKNYSAFTKTPLALHTIPYCGNFRNKSGYTNLLVDKSRCKLYASCMDNIIYCFNISTYNNTQPEMKYIGHSSTTFYIKNSLSPDGKYLVSGSSDENAYIWNINYREPIVELVGHSAEVTCATWCGVEEIKIVTCSDDARIKIWRVGKEWLDEDDKLDLRGKSETVVATQTSCWTLETTPNHHSKRQASSDITPLSNVKRLCRRNSESADKICKSSRNIKRSLIDILNTDSFSFTENKPQLLSPIPEGNSEDQKENLGLGLLDWKKSDSHYHAKRIKLSQDEKVIGMISGSSASFSTPYFTSICKTPTKINNGLLNPPKRSRSIDCNEINLNKLPDYAIDGSAPHRSLMSPRKKRQATDWLSAIAEEKRLKLEMNPTLSTTHTPNNALTTPASSGRSPAAEKGKNRRNSAHESTPKRIKPNLTLHTYFQPK